VEPKPSGWDRRYAEWFNDSSVVENYRFRPEYPAELFTFLATLAGESGAVLDAGCGPGDIARPLAQLVRRVDAVDLSPRMISEGRTRADGAASNLVWLTGAIEDVDLDGPYDLVVAGDSVHWFDWRAVFPRFATVLAPGGHLAIVSRNWFTAPELRRRFGPIYERFAANRDFRPLDPIVELERRGVFVRVGDHTTAPTSWRPTLDEILGCHHAQSGFDLERMTVPDAAAFDDAVEGAMRTFVREGTVVERAGRFDLEMTSTVVWGRPSGDVPGSASVKMRR
jgi:SAM-dependent methyltransferase